MGIRSQSKPNDIMLEVYRAMKALDYEWKIINSYHVRVRRLNAQTSKYAKMSLQLYQVDAKSYLLDFKSLTNDEVEQGDDVILESFTPPASLGGGGATFGGSGWNSPATIGSGVGLNVITPPVPPSQATGHHTMEFFEMCAALIIQLAR